MAKIITVTGYKGGIGKSTTAFHLAAYFSQAGKTVLVDGDPNRTAIKWAARLEEGELPFVVADERQAMRLVGDSEFVVIDTPARPNSDDLKELSKGCDLLILPTAPDILSLEPMLETAGDLAGATYRALLTVVPPRPSREGEIMQQDLRESGLPVFDTMIRRAAAFAKAAMAGKPVRDMKGAPAQAAWEDYQALGNEIKELI